MDLFLITRGWVAILELGHGSQTAELRPQVSQILTWSQTLQHGTDFVFTAMLHFPLLSCLRFIFKPFFFLLFLDRLVLSGLSVILEIDLFIDTVDTY